MEPIALAGSLREGIGKEAAKKIRAAGSTPAVLYGHGMSESVNLQLDPKVLNKALENPKKANALMSVDLGSDAGSHTVLVREVQRHPVKRTILHVDLVVPDLEKNITATVPLRFIGKSVGVSMGGRLRTPYREVNVSARPADIPVDIEVDITPLDMGDLIKASELNAGENVSVVYDEDFVVVKVLKPRGGAKTAAESE